MGSQTDRDGREGSGGSSDLPWGRRWSSSRSTRSEEPGHCVSHGATTVPSDPGGGRTNRPWGRGTWEWPRGHSGLPVTPRVTTREGVGSEPGVPRRRFAGSRGTPESGSPGNSEAQETSHPGRVPDDSRRVPRTPRVDPRSTTPFTQDGTAGPPDSKAVETRVVVQGPRRGWGGGPSTLPRLDKEELTE